MSNTSTMSLKARIRNIAKSKHIAPQAVLQNYLFERLAIEDICTMPGDDALSFHFTGISMIRDDDEYGDFRVSLNAVLEVINAPLSIDITFGDVITPKPVKRIFKTFFD